MPTLRSDDTPKTPDTPDTPEAREATADELRELLPTSPYGTPYKKARTPVENAPKTRDVWRRVITRMKNDEEQEIRRALSLTLCVDPQTNIKSFLQHLNTPPTLILLDMGQQKSYGYCDPAYMQLHCEASVR
ncbi:hypothetical protein H0H92_003671 [Tricholoma furcatifolium]|nr:hypothetical protein H0H92_003671 [Tricholoma furcatifolium]